ncbi:hypothetical protein [Candidatus Uabimicrobium sp. HlEnr_7]|uniref:hypothetical protein n=1 Tax=Candidatus Uabimicrobium helgolandensis TaxID=3095367 RepID=UPI003557E613
MNNIIMILTAIVYSVICNASVESKGSYETENMVIDIVLADVDTTHYDQKKQKKMTISTKQTLISLKAKHNYVVVGKLTTNGKTYTIPQNNYMQKLPALKINGHVKDMLLQYAVRTHKETKTIRSKLTITKQYQNLLVTAFYIRSLSGSGGVIATEKELEILNAIDIVLAVKQDTYKLDLDGMTSAEFSTKLKQWKKKSPRVRGELKSPPIIIIDLFLLNNSKHQVVFEIGKDSGYNSIKGKGAGFLSINTVEMHTTQYIYGEHVRLQPEGYYHIPLSMKSGSRSSVYNFWTTTGKCQLDFQVNGMVRELNGVEIFSTAFTIDTSGIEIYVIK